MNIKPEFIKGFQKIGFTNLTVEEVVSCKSTGVTPEYVASMKEKGFNSKDIHKYIQLRATFE